MSDPVETSELLAFSKTVDSKSLSRAAAELGVPRATVSRRLARLEQRLGARLLRRTTRSLVLTDAGETLYRHARIVLDAVSHAEASVRSQDDAIRGDLRVSVPPMMHPSFFALINEFATAHPNLRLHVHFSTALVDLRRDGYDVALRASGVMEPGLIARKLAPAQLITVAAPAYLAEHGVPRRAKDLRAHRCLMGFARGELPASHWPLAGGGQVHVEGVFFSNDMWLLCDAAVRGLGIALLPIMVVHPLLESGVLKHVLDGIVQADGQIAVVYAEREFVPPQVRAFVDAVVAWAAEDLPKGLPPGFADIVGRHPRAAAGDKPRPKPAKRGAKSR